MKKKTGKVLFACVAVILVVVVGMAVKQHVMIGKDGTSISIIGGAELADKDQTIYVYCRSGNRSKQASAKLAAMGYTHVVEFGSILDWTGEIVKEG